MEPHLHHHHQQQQQQQLHEAPAASCSDLGASKTNSSTFNLPSPTSPSSYNQHPGVPPHAHINHQPPYAHQHAHSSQHCAPGRAASVHGGGLTDLKYRPPQKFASFNHNLQSGRREDQFVRSSRELCINSEDCSEEGNSSDDAAEEKATWELLSRRSSAEQAACMQRRSTENQISHRRKLSSASSLPVMMTASSYDLSELASVAAVDSAPAVVQEELQQMQRQQTLTDDKSTAAQSQPRQRGSYHLTHGQAAVELFLRLSRARQTLDFVRRQASMFASLNHTRMSIWEALSQFSGLREYEAALFDPAGALLDPDMPLMQHALQSAELCRLNFPDKDWMHLVGLIHGLGKLLAHPMFGSQPQWAICGESFPVGCRFDSRVSGSQFFTVNPDRRRRLLNTPLGIYKPRCGLQHVFMSWGAPEFLYLVLSLNLTRLPQEALFLLRNQKFLTLTKTGSSGYHHLLSPEDEALLPLLRDFQRIIMYRRVPIPDHARLKDSDLHRYYEGLIEKYVPGVLLW